MKLTITKYALHFCLCNLFVVNSILIREVYIQVSSNQENWDYHGVNESVFLFLKKIPQLSNEYKYLQRNAKSTFQTLVLAEWLRFKLLDSKCPEFMRKVYTKCYLDNQDIVHSLRDSDYASLEKSVLIFLESSDNPFVELKSDRKKKTVGEICKIEVPQLKRGGIRSSHNTNLVQHRTQLNQRIEIEDTVFFPIYIYSLQENWNYKLVNDSVSVFVKKMSQQSSDYKRLEKNANGSFEIPVLDEWFQFKIIDSKGCEFIRKVYPKYYVAINQAIVFYIGEMGYVAFDKGIPRFYEPVDDIYIEIKTKGDQNDTIARNISEIGIYRSNKDLNRWSLDTNLVKRTCQLDQLAEIEGILVAPLHPNSSQTSIYYFSNEVILLFQSNTSSKEIDALFRKNSIVNFQKIDLSSDAMEYGKHIAFRVKYENKMMIDYGFLKSLSKMYENTNVLMIKTDVFSLHKPD